MAEQVSGEDPANRSWDVGQVRVTRVEERVIPMAWDDLIPGGAELVESCQPWIDPYISPSGDELLLSVHSFVVRTPSTLLVVDTCIGPEPGTSLPGDPGFADRLDAALPGGIDAVDIVVCTHLHFDHVGWNTVVRNGAPEPTFPNARYLVTHDELSQELDAEDSAAFQRSIAPLQSAGQLDVVMPNHRIDPWVSLEPTPGHTAGHVSVRIEDGSTPALITGDLIHSPLQFRHPTAPASSDAAPADAIRTRERVIAEAIENGTLLLGTHFPQPTAGHLSQERGSIEFS